MIILPQIQTFREEYDKDAYDSIYNINFNHIVKPLEFEPKLGDFVLNREAVATDILDCIMLNPHFGLLCNEKVLKILKRHKLPNFKIYEASIYDYNGKRLRSKYYWIHIICSLAERINFKASSFKIVTRRGIKKGNITINSEEELKEKKKVINYFHYIRIDKAYFNQKVDYDILRLGLLASFKTLK